MSIPEKRNDTLSKYLSHAEWPDRQWIRQKFDQYNQVLFESSSFTSREEEKKYNNEDAYSDDSFRSSSSNQDELDFNYWKQAISLFEMKFKELKTN